MGYRSKQNTQKKNFKGLRNTKEMFNILSCWGNVNQNYLRFHFTPVRMTTISNTSNNLLMGMQTCTATVEINMVVPQKIRNQSTTGPSCTTCTQILKEHSILPPEHLCNYVHSDFIHNSQKLETTQMSLNQREDILKYGIFTKWSISLSC